MTFLSSNKQFASRVEDEYTDANLLTVEAPPLFAAHVLGAGKLGICLDGVTLSNGMLALHGWAMGYDRINVLRDGEIIRAEISRQARPDVNAEHPDMLDEAPGFTIVVPNARTGEYSLQCAGRGAEHTFLLPIDFHALQAAPDLNGLPHVFEDVHTIAGAIDKSLNLGDGGLLIFGWLIDFHGSLQSVTFHSEGRQPLDVTKQLFRTPRPDIMRNYAARHPEVTEMCGFIIRVNQQINADATYGLCFSCGDRRQICVGGKAGLDTTPPLQLIKDVLASVPHPERIRHSLYDLFDRLLGEPIAAVADTMRKHRRTPQVKQFGTLPQTADVSVIVPLYGRYDFLKYQMARFHSDPDFTRVDLMYVIDDPGILSATLEMAALAYDLYRLPFRVIWYNRNLGFAGANNVGAALAVAPKLLLLNSDVIPQQPCWVSALTRSLDEPGVGAVGPLLQFYDGSVQHAGMAPSSSPHYPGFIFNAHPGKGAHTPDLSVPYEVPLLTAACLMMHAADYQETGGLDEGYIIGDFEDSDICLKLRHRGLKLILNPEPKLYHLERQSQNLEAITSSRHLLTLYNGWRYTRKIRNGEIANPGGVA